MTRKPRAAGRLSFYRSGEQILYVLPDKSFCPKLCPHRFDTAHSPQARRGKFVYPLNQDRLACSHSSDAAAASDHIVSPTSSHHFSTRFRCNWPGSITARLPRRRAVASGVAQTMSFAEGAAAVVSFSLRRAPVAQWIEHRPPEPGAQVRILSGVPSGGVSFSHSSLFFTPPFTETDRSPPAAGSNAPARPRPPAACTRE